MFVERWRHLGGCYCRKNKTIVAGRESEGKRSDVYCRLVSELAGTIKMTNHIKYVTDM